MTNDEEATQMEAKRQRELLPVLKEVSEQLQWASGAQRAINVLKTAILKVSTFPDAPKEILSRTAFSLANEYVNRETEREPDDVYERESEFEALVDTWRDDE